jgi:hypothetical protein
MKINVNRNLQRNKAIDAELKKLRKQKKKSVNVRACCSFL